MGRPSSFTEEIAAEICAQIIEGKSLRTICLADDMPDVRTVMRWVSSNPLFRQQYARAKEEQADALVEEILDISDDGTNDWMEARDKDGAAIGWRENGEAIQRSKLRVDTRKWVASKLKAKKYGDSASLRVGGEDGGPIKAEITISSILQSIDGKTASLPARTDDDTFDAEFDAQKQGD
ncbi:MAG: terminase small subunit protein [Spirochaetes bacterium]|nr:MAG: terminase small subunit protein [Spirochaetota bacterium]